MPFHEEDLFDMTYIFDSIDSFTEGIEQHFDSVSRSLKDTFRTSPWLPDSIKPLPPPPVAKKLSRIPAGYLEASRDWISEHRAITAAAAAFIGTGTFIIWRRRRSDRVKRRAKRAKNGARTEVVILVGSPHSPLTHSLSFELERRGFIIYIPVSSLSEEQLIQSQSRPDIRALSLDITSPESTEETIRKFSAHINAPQRPISKAPSHSLHLCAFILVPGPSLAANSISTLSPPNWSDILNTRLLAPFSTIHAFLPLLTSQKSTLLFLTPSIVPSLSPASHAGESVVAGGHQHFISTLRKEVRGQDVNVAQFQLGHFDYGLAVEDHQQQLVLSQHLSVAEVTKERLETRGLVNKPKGTSLRELHNDVFDAIARGKGRNGTTFVGRGSRTYDIIGKWVPSRLVELMMGAAKMEDKVPIIEKAKHEGTSESGWDKVGERDSDEEANAYAKQ